MPRERRLSPPKPTWPPARACRARDKLGKLTYTDLEAPGFEEGAARNGYLDYETALSSFHAVTAEGELLKGMPVFKAAYDAVGLGWVWAVYDNPIAAKVLDFGYGLFARFRTDLTRGASLEALYAARRAARAAACVEEVRTKGVSEVAP